MGGKASGGAWAPDLGAGFSREHAARKNGEMAPARRKRRRCHARRRRASSSALSWCRPDLSGSHAPFASFKMVDRAVLWRGLPVLASAWPCSLVRMSMPSAQRILR